MKTYAWDFRGLRAAAIAEHHAEHLREFLQREGLEGCEVWVETPAQFQASAFLRATTPAQAGVDRALRPPRVV